MKNHGNDNKLLDRYLSGDISADELPEGLRREEARLRELMGSLDEEVHYPPALRVAVMREVERLHIPLWRRMWDWAARPRLVRVSPLSGAALAFAATAALIFVSSQNPSPALPPAGVGSSTGGIVTRFVFVAPEARSVHLTGDFVSWSTDGIALDDLRGTGIWTVDVELAPGVHEYTFIVDGTEWQPDPRAVSQVDDGFGRVNSIVIVPGESAA